MIESFRSFNREHKLIEKGDSVVVGVSGGADSLCLLHLLYTLRERWEISIHVLHINHGIRGDEAKRDAEFVRQFATERQLPFELVTVDVPGEAKKMKMSEEEAGRHLRYRIMEEYRAEWDLDYIATAHHRDDQAETVLFRLFRGTGPRGLAGIPVKRGHIIRPLLFAGKDEIERYLRRQGIAWCEDSTNREQIYTRNRIRHELLPRIERDFNAKAGLHIAQTAEKIEEWRRYIDGMAQDLYERSVEKRGEEVILSVQTVLAEDVVLQREVFRRIMEEPFAGLRGIRDVGQSHFDDFTGLLCSDTGHSLSLPHEIVAEKSYDVIRFYKIDKNKGKKGNDTSFLPRECPVPSTQIVEDSEGIWEIGFTVKKREDLDEKIPQKDYTKWFDYDKIKGMLVLRNPCKGDFFIVDAMGHRKKLSRYYIDQKIARSDRYSQLVLAEGNHVLWAIPGRISESCKIDEQTKNVLVVTRERAQI